MDRFWYVLSGFSFLSCLLSFLTLFSLYSYYKNKIFINIYSLTCFFSDEKHLIALYFILWAEFAIGRVCNGPRVL